MERWYIVDDNNIPIISNSFREIGSYKGKFIEFNGYEFRLLDYNTTKRIPVYGTYYKNNTSTLTYYVGGRYVKIYKKRLNLGDKSISDFIKENKTLKLVISNIDFKKQTVYALPYKDELVEKKEYPPFETGQIIKGEIIKVHPFGIRVKCEDERKTLIHISRLQELGYGDYQFEQSQTITIKKIGFDDIHHKDIWEITSI